MPQSEFPTRREFLQRSAVGVAGGATAFAASGLCEAGAAERPSPLAAKPPHFAARAKAVIFLMMEGGPSQIDTFDPKPKLEQLDGQVFKRENVKTSQVSGTRHFVKSPFKFKHHGESGIAVSELFSETAKHVDDLAILRSGYGDSDNHPAAVFQYTTGFPVQGNPSIGSWVIYGLGSENVSLPPYVVLRDGKPFGGTTSWGNGFLPALYQGMQFRGGDHPVLNLKPPAGVTEPQQQASLDLLLKLNRRHLADRAEFTDFAARIASYELADRMQREIPEAIDIHRETAATQRLYGLEEDKTKTFGRRCLLARRLIERGVRYVQIWSGGWDSHDDVLGGHRNSTAQVDRPIAGLLADLKQRGMLDDTLVVWGGEFGRTADTTEAAFKKKKPGRDHNPKATLMWFAGGGVRAGQTIGATDEVGDAAAEDRYHLNDIHATLLYLLGLDQEKL
ncbi:MAG: DUF1501 domain-containing protein, partial [Pirellulaceae bacterium]|nr:DUF1501 domain-containing protein [Pirellulaceae bacterium]